MSAEGWIHGTPIAFSGEKHKSPGELRYLSPSAITLADAESDGCLRKWAWKYVAGKKEPETSAQKVGTALHAELEHYVKTGQRDLSALALAGLHMVPVPNLALISRGENDLVAEAEMSSEFSSKDPDVAFTINEAFALRQAGDYTGAASMLRSLGIVTASGVPVIGRIDLVHARGTNQGADDFEDALDPANTVEVYDWKTSSNVKKYGKTKAQLARNIQMLAYGMWVLQNGPDVQHVRLSHGYFQTKGRAYTTKVSTRLDRPTLVQRWEYADNLARQIVDAAREPDPNKVPANYSACEAFGGCPHRSYCEAGMARGLKGFFPAAKLKQKPSTDDDKQTKGTDHMGGFLDKLRQTDKARTEGAAAKNAIDPRFAPAWKTITALGLGDPTTGGEVAKQLALYQGRTDFTSSGIAGTGDMGKATVITMDELLEIAAECAAEDATPAAETTPTPTVVTPVAPDSPASDPKMASAGPEGKDPTKAEKAAPKAKAPKATPTTKATTADASGKSTIYVDALEFGGAFSFTTLNAWVQDIADQISAEAGGDLRSVSEKPLGFGGWKGVLAMYVRNAAEHPLPAGTYYLDTRESEIMLVAAEALRHRDDVARVIRGVR